VTRPDTLATRAPAPRTGTVEVPGGEIWFTVRGEGPPLFHVHGSGLGHANFSQREKMDEHGGRVVCPQCKSQDVERVMSGFYARTPRKS